MSSFVLHKLHSVFALMMTGLGLSLYLHGYIWARHLSCLALFIFSTTLCLRGERKTSTEVALMLLTQQPQVRIPTFFLLNIA